MYIFERVTKKFKGDIGLWIQYSEVAKKEGARKLVGKVLASSVHIPQTPYDDSHVHPGLHADMISMLYCDAAVLSFSTHSPPRFTFCSRRTS